MADLLMLASRQIRLAVHACLQSPTFAGMMIDTPGSWETPGAMLPAILFRCPHVGKQSITKGQPEFTSLITIEIEARAAGATATAAQDAIEALAYNIEQAILTNHDLISIINQVASIDMATEISSEGGLHIGGSKMSFVFEVPEMYDPFVNVTPVPFTSIGIHMDMIDKFDPSGTYPTPTFPASVVPAPRTSGPDGRDEGFLDITLPQ